MFTCILIIKTFPGIIRPKFLILVLFLRSLIANEGVLQQQREIIKRLTRL